MKRINNLFENFISFDNILLAYKNAFKGTNKNRETLSFHFNCENEIIKLIEELKTGSYKPSPYRKFIITDPKERIISVAPFRDRVIHHSLVNIIEPIFEKRFYFHSYACRKDKGVHKAVKQAQTYLKTNKWYFKSDISKYFASVDHQILFDILKSKIKDKEILDLLYKIIINGDDTGKSLPIGNLTSQFFANVYLDILDHFVKEELQVKAYVRYMDDFVLFDNDKEKLKLLKQKISGFIHNRLALSLKEKSTFLNQRLNGLNFLGRRIFPVTIRIKRENLKRCLKKLESREKEYQNGVIDDKQYVQSVNSLMGYIASGNTYCMRQSIEI
ncbi:MAG: group II intron reverse transcriptase domain-containing protein [Spirochaetes bacterium]|nr:group II intron reverse transcriptase domain-containing protein [Spirochaetota bacterium]